MADSPINFMMYGHTADYLQSQQLKNKLLKEKLSLLMRQLTTQKEQNLKHLKQIDNQQQIMRNLKGQIKTLENKQHSTPSNSLTMSKQLPPNNNSSSSSHLDLRYRVTSRSTELPNKKVYLDTNNKSIESSFQSQIMDKKLRLDSKNVKRITSYGNLYNKKSFSLNKPIFK